MMTPKKISRRVSRAEELATPASGKKTRKHEEFFTPAKEDLPQVENKRESVTPLKPGVAESKISQPLARSDSAPLPSHYEILFKQFKALEEVLAIMRTRSTIPLLSEAGGNVADVTKHRFNFARMQQIMEIAPDMFKIQWREVSPGKPPQALVMQVEEGSEVAERITNAVTMKRRELVFKNLVARVDQARLRVGAAFDMESDCPPVEVIESKEATTPRTPKTSRLELNLTPAKYTSSLTVSRSPMTPIHLPRLVPTTPRTPRDASLTPKQQVEAMRQRIRAKEADEAEKFAAQETENKKRQSIAEFDDLLAMLAQLAKKLYGKSSMRLDALVKEVNRSSIRFGGAPEVEKLIRKLSELVPDWLSLTQSEFAKDVTLVKVDHGVGFATVQKAIREQQEVARTKAG